MVSWSLQWENISGNGFWYLKCSVPTFLVTSNNLSKASKRGFWKKARKSVGWNRSWSWSSAKVCFEHEDELKKSLHLLKLQIKKPEYESASQIRNSRQQVQVQVQARAHWSSPPVYMMQMKCSHYTMQASWKNRLIKLHSFLHSLSLSGMDWFFLFLFLSKRGIVSYNFIQRRVTYHMFQTAIFETEFSGPRLKNLNLDMCVIRTLESSVPRVVYPVPLLFG